MDPIEVPKIRNWVDEWGGGVDYVDYLRFSGDLAVLVAYSRILWPKFIEVDGCILRDRVHEESNFRDWRQRLSKPRDVEMTLNQINVSEMVETDEGDWRALGFLATCIMDSWRAALHACFPGRDFQVVLLESDDGPIVTFCSVAAYPVDPDSSYGA